LEESVKKFIWVVTLPAAPSSRILSARGVYVLEIATTCERTKKANLGRDSS
jgi:hypothetical protein